MRESKFVEQNQAKWADFEKELSFAKKDPEKLRAQLIQVTDDLSYAKTFYKNRSVRVYLNGLAQKIYINIYKNKKNFRKSVIQFFKEEVPQISWYSRKTILVAFILLVLVTAIGAFSAAKDEQFSRAILGNDYIDMTINNIKEGNPMGVYKDENAFSMFIKIALNNLQVSFFVFIFGIFAGYGSIVFLIRNGIMLGVFMHLFYSRGQVAHFNYTVWMHGTIEILTIVICTAAGMLLGKGFIQPGTLSRYKAFSIWGRRGAMLYLSTVPFIIFAAFIESYLTRHTDLPNILRLIFILLCLALMVFYFVYYPYLKFKNKKDEELGLPELSAENSWQFEKTMVYNNGQLFLKTIQIISENFSKIMRYIFALVAIYMFILASISLKNSIQKFELTSYDAISTSFNIATGNIGYFFNIYSNVSLFFNQNETFMMYVLSSLWIALVCFAAFKIANKYFAEQPIHWLKSLLFCMVFSYSFNLLMLSDNNFVIFIYILLSPIFIGLLAHKHYGIMGENRDRTVQYLFTNYMRLLGVLLLFLLISFLAFLFVLSSFSYIIIYFMEINVAMTESTYTLTIQSLMFFGFAFVTSFCIVFYILQLIMTVFSIKEISTAEGLINAIDDIGKVNKSYGIETE